MDGLDLAGSLELLGRLGRSPAPLFQHHVSSSVSTSRTAEPLRPATLRQMLLAGFLCRELSLKFMQIRGKRWTGHPLTLYLVACWHPRRLSRTRNGRMNRQLFFPPLPPRG